jgi:hypothetical protein
MNIIDVLNDLKHCLKSRHKDDLIAEALNDAVNKIIIDFNLDQDKHIFASLPGDPTNEK